MRFRVPGPRFRVEHSNSELGTRNSERSLSANFFGNEAEPFHAAIQVCAVGLKHPGRFRHVAPCAREGRANQLPFVGIECFGQGETAVDFSGTGLNLELAG